jgi:CyaY protein
MAHSFISYWKIPMSDSNLTDAEFHRRADGVLSSLEQQLDAWLQDDVIDIDAERTGGLLEMTFPSGSKIVINTQPPLHELWLAAQLGGFHFKYTEAEQAWRDTKTGKEFFSVLSEQISHQANQELVLCP